MKLNLSRTVINLFLIFVAVGLLWYILKSQNLLYDKPKSTEFKQTTVEIPFNEKSYLLDYKKFDSQMVENIGLFTAEEKWKGGGFYDTDTFVEFPSSLYIAGGERNKITNVRDVSLNLERIISFDFVLNFRNNPDDLETADLSIIDSNARSAVYVLPKLNNGWQVFAFPKEQFVTDTNFSWANVVRVKINFTPRPNGKVMVNFGSLRGQPGSILYNDWNVLNPNMLVMDKRNGIISLLARNIGSSVAVIKKITLAQNFTFKSSYIPLNRAYSGLFFRGNYQNGLGYYLLMAGINNNQWQIYKNTKEGVKVLTRGEINNFQFKSNEKYYFKVETKGNNIKAFFSTDSINYTLLADFFDEEFLSGGIGIAVVNGAAALFNDFEFTQ